MVMVHTVVCPFVVPHEHKPRNCETITESKITVAIHAGHVERTNDLKKDLKKVHPSGTQIV